LHRSTAAALRRLLLLWTVATVVGPGVPGVGPIGPIAVASTEGATSEVTEWLPLVGDPLEVVCTWNNPQNGCVKNGDPYHPYPAIDFGADNDTPVYAAGAGTVYALGGCPPYTPDPTCNGRAGNYIRIWHSDEGLYSRYLHLSSFVVTSGHVDGGQLIAYSGNSGDSEDPHLHYDETTSDESTKLDPGVMFACHGSTQVSYPNQAGADTWPGLTLPAYLENDGYSCEVPPVGPPENLRVGGDLKEIAALSWDPPVTGGAAAYEVFRNSVLLAKTSSLSFVDVALARDALYAYAVRAIDAEGSPSPFSTPVTIKSRGEGEGGRAWVDFNADGRADYCRRVGNAYPTSRISCTTSTGRGFGRTYISRVLDWGYETGRAWVDFNADGRADYCRRVGNAYPASRISCTTSTGRGFGRTYISRVLDWGYETGRAWVDFNADGRADYCRRVGNAYPASRISCTKSTGRDTTGFGRTFISSPLDWGYET
jgi:hypothetical protein